LFARICDESLNQKIGAEKKMKHPEAFSKVEGLRRITSLQEACELAGGSQRLQKIIFISVLQ